MNCIEGPLGLLNRIPIRYVIILLIAASTGVDHLARATSMLRSVSGYRYTSTSHLLTCNIVSMVDSTESDVPMSTCPGMAEIKNKTIDPNDNRHSWDPEMQVVDIYHDNMIRSE